MNKEQYIKPELELICLGQQLNILTDLSNFDAEGSIDEWEVDDPNHTISAN